MSDDDAVPWAGLLSETEARLARAGVEGAGQEAAWIVGEASGLDAAEVLAGDALATVGGVRRLDAMVGRRLGGEPLQYVLGCWAFRHVDLMVDPRVLIPRPETEQVAGWALDELGRRRSDAPDRELVAVDLGTGSGAIALSLAVEGPSAVVWATDRSPAALAVARANLTGIGRAAARVRLAEGSWYEALPTQVAGTVDVVVANPPYIAADEELPAEVASWEPADALVSGPSGLEALEVVVDGAPRWLAPGGALVVELAPGQADVVAERARAVGLVDVEVRHDLAERARALVAHRPA